MMTMTKTDDSEHQAGLTYGVAILACRSFCSAIDSLDEVKMHRAAASLTKCIKTIAKLQGPTKRLRRILENLQSSMRGVYSKYTPEVAADTPTPRLNRQELGSVEYRKFQRDLSRAEGQRPSSE